MPEIAGMILFFLLSVDCLSQSPSKISRLPQRTTTAVATQTASVLQMNFSSEIENFAENQLDAVERLSMSRLQEIFDRYKQRGDNVINQTLELGNVFFYRL